MLSIYTAAHCYGCARARDLATQVAVQRADIVVEVIDVGAPGVALPSQVIGTPMYLWDGRVMFMGNPELSELLDRLDQLQPVQCH
jgi:hypothetical protein